MTHTNIRPSGLKPSERSEPPSEQSSELPLLDTTAPLPLHSKRTERLQKKRHLQKKASQERAAFHDLPSELLLQVLTLLVPRDIFALSSTSRGFQTFIFTNQTRISEAIITFRYPVLTKSFPLPRLLEDVPKEAHSALLSEERQTKHLHIHTKPYQHILPPNPNHICTCLTCILAWNNLCVIVDFAYWQKGHLDKGEPIPMIPRGKNPKWNRILISNNSSIVWKAISHPLWYMLLLSVHLDSIQRSILRHSSNSGNKRRRFHMSVDDMRADTDAFLERNGPPSLDFPFHRDNYYMLEAFVPNRVWAKNNGEEGEFKTGEWKYMSNSQHERDVEFVIAYHAKREEIEKKELEEHVMKI